MHTIISMKCSLALMPKVDFPFSSRAEMQVEAIEATCLSILKPDSPRSMASSLSRNLQDQNLKRILELYNKAHAKECLFAPGPHCFLF